MYMGGVSTPPYIGGALGGTVGSDFPPNLSLRGVGGRIGGSVGARFSLFLIVEMEKRREKKAAAHSNLGK